MLALLVDLLLSADEIGRLGVGKLGLLEDLPEDEQDSSVGVAEVAGDETLRTPGLKLVEADEDEGNGTQEEAEVGGPGVPGGNVVESRVVEALSLAGAVPADKDDDHHGVGGDETGGGEVDEPEEDGNGGFAGDEEGDAADDADSHDAVDGDTSLGALHEDRRGLAIAGKTVEGSGRGVQVGVTARETGGEDQEVDEIGEASNAKVLNYRLVSIVTAILSIALLTSNDPGRGSSTSSAALNGTEQTGILRAADDTDSQDTKDVETNKSVEDELGNSGDGSSRVLDLTRGEGDHIRAGNGETSVEDNLPPTAEASKIALGVVGLHGLATAPVTESISVLLGVSTAHGDEGDEEEAEQEEDLERGHDELGFTVVPEVWLEFLGQHQASKALT